MLEVIAMQLKTGSRYRSAVDDTQVVVVHAGQGDVDVTCGGHPLLPLDGDAEPRLTVLNGHAGGTQVGKRYSDADTGVELLCTRAGAAALFADGRPLTVKTAKPLPASD
jgi:hypothetical protein